GLKLVNDAAHSFIVTGPNDIRGSCSALNTLVSHGYLPRNGTVRPDQIVTATMEGMSYFPSSYHNPILINFSSMLKINLGNDFGKFLTCQAFLMNSNPLTNLTSLGIKSPLTGPDPARQPASVGGLNQRGTFEGDTSMTRVDAYFGDQSAFDETLFQGVCNDEYIRQSDIHLLCGVLFRNHTT
ncbi:hypothetical protein M422DRAFT_150647, partial [Sphaerobolus stellatus SS14]